MAALEDKLVRSGDGYATEYMEIASHELLERVAKRAGEKGTAAVARQNRDEEEAMARAISSKWSKIVDLSLEEAGAKVSTRKPARRRARPTAARRARVQSA